MYLFYVVIFPELLQGLHVWPVWTGWTRICPLRGHRGLCEWVPGSWSHHRALEKRHILSWVSDHQPHLYGDSMFSKCLNSLLLRRLILLIDLPLVFVFSPKPWPALPTAIMSPVLHPASPPASHLPLRSVSDRVQRGVCVTKVTSSVLASVFRKTAVDASTPMAYTTRWTNRFACFVSFYSK